MNDLLEKVIAILYPRCCPICGEIVAERGKLICGKCEEHVCPIREPMCKKCGKPLGDVEKEYCFDCTNSPHLYVKGAALLAYQGKVKESIYQIKFHNKREYLDYYGELMYRELKERVQQWNADMLLAVPLHWKKRRDRGFNQAELLAEKLAKGLGIPLAKKVLYRRRLTKPQKELLLKERRANLKNAFIVKGESVKGKTIIIVDDIYTTGTTIDEITKELLLAGAHAVYFLVLCIGQEDC